MDHLTSRAHIISPANFDRLLKQIQRLGRYCPKAAKVLSTPAPWDAECDKIAADHG